MNLTPDPGHRTCFKTVDLLRLSSQAKKPVAGKPVVPGRALHLKPGCRLVVFLNRVRFTWSVPLRVVSKRGNCGPGSGNDMDGTQRMGRKR